MLSDQLKKEQKFAIYGAQVIAYGAYVAIKELYGIVPECFAVSNPKENLLMIEEIPVRPIEMVEKNTFIVVGVTELVQKEVVPFLKENGYHKLFVLTQHEEHLLMSAYYNHLGMFPQVSSKLVSSGGQVKDLRIFEVKNHRDKPLAAHPELYPWECAIQAGAAITEDRIAEVRDNTGDNISLKNKQYCEMSATYWVWKNTCNQWTGIEHYRRHLLIKPEMLGDDVDVILPLPYICYPNEMAQFRRFVDEEVFQALLKALKQVHPDEYDAYYSILYGKYQYTYNLVCARREVFEAYCSWFFEITEYMETLADEVPQIRETRALSYVAEVLTNLYFMYHQNDLNILHVEKEIYV